MRVKLAKVSYYLQANGNYFNFVHSGEVSYAYRVGTLYSHDLAAASSPVSITPPQSENSRYNVMIYTNDSLNVQVAVTSLVYGSTSSTNTFTSVVSAIRPLSISCRRVTSLVITPLSGSGRLHTLVASTVAVTNDSRLGGSVITPELDIRQDPQGGDPIIVIVGGSGSGSSGGGSGSNPFVIPSTRAGEVPIGGIVYYSGVFNQTTNVYTELGVVPSSYWLCDGSVISDPESPLYGYKTPNLLGKVLIAAEQYQSPQGSGGINETVEFIFGMSENWAKPASINISGQSSSGAYLCKAYMRIK